MQAATPSRRSNTIFQPSYASSASASRRRCYGLRGGS